MNLTPGDFDFSSAQLFRPISFFLALIVLCGGGPVSAQTVQYLDQVKSTAVLAKLSDVQLRELLVQHLEKVESLSADSSGFDPSAAVEQLQQDVGKVQSRFILKSVKILSSR